MSNSVLLKYNTDFVRLSNTLTDFCQKAQTDCHSCPFNDELDITDSCPIDQAIGMIDKIYKKAEAESDDDTTYACPF